MILQMRTWRLLGDFLCLQLIQGSVLYVFWFNCESDQWIITIFSTTRCSLTFPGQNISKNIFELFLDFRKIIQNFCKFRDIIKTSGRLRKQFLFVSKLFCRNRQEIFSYFFLGLVQMQWLWSWKKFDEEIIYNNFWWILGKKTLDRNRIFSLMSQILRNYEECLEIFSAGLNSLKLMST